MSDRFKYTFGLGHVGSYQTSAKPFLSSSLTVPASDQEPLEVQFPNVSRFIVITNSTNPSDPPRPIRFGFSSNGIKGLEDNNYVVLENGETFEAEFRVAKVFLLSDGIHEGSGSVVGGMTGISSSNLKTNWSGSIGVG